MKLVDVYGDGDYKLVLADADKRLKMYKGSTLHGEQAILASPVALCAFYSGTLSIFFFFLLCGLY